ncbi:MAG: hypothetical protein U5R48_11375 [Gammaproteobacteria bacterium]|nr:hypothetical protein [Gammaproteobacteria bacterium]
MVFDEVAELRLPDHPQPRILVATQGDWPGRELLLERAAELAPRLRRFGVAPRTLAEALDPDYEFDRDARIITDQYAPVNLLR